MAIALPTEIIDTFTASEPARNETTGLYEIVLDVAADENAESPAEFGALFGLSTRVIQGSGPSGWPEVEYTGTAMEIAAMLVEYNGLRSIRIAELIEIARRIRTL